MSETTQDSLYTSVTPSPVPFYSERTFGVQGEPYVMITNL